MAKARPALGALIGMLLAGCAGLTEVVAPAGQVQWDGLAPLGDPTCVAESYDFVGEATLAGLGLEGAVPATLPTPERRAMIWVTHELKPFDAGPAGGPVEMTRMLCFQFADGSGGTEWPVDAAWQAPGQAALGVTEGVSVPPTLLLVGLGLLLAIAVSVMAFRRRS